MFTCWSLVSTMLKRYPEIELDFYPIDKKLNCSYPTHIKGDELLVFIHYFGHENKMKLPKSNGVILEDVSHSITSNIPPKGDLIFGSLRKTFLIGDGGFINSYYNPIYEKSRKLDTWLRYEAHDWKDMREAENMIDREFQIADISSQSLEIIFKANFEMIRKIRQENNDYLNEHIEIGHPLIKYKKNESPLLHNRIFESKEVRDSLRKYLMKKNIFTSIHWPTHKIVKNSNLDNEASIWIENHIISIPIAQNYNLDDMLYISKCINEWQKT